MKNVASDSYEKPRIRGLTPFAQNSGPVNDTVVKCAREYAKAFDANPINPSLKGIAAAVGCSRNAVKAHLKEAQRTNLLSLNLRLPKDETLSQKLAAKYGLAEVVVSLTPAKWGDQDSIRTALAPEAMRYLENACIRLAHAWGNQGTIRIGLDGGLTLYKAVHDMVAQQFPTKPKYEFVPLVFGPLEDSKYTASMVANLLASKLENLGFTIQVQDAFAINADSWRTGRRARHDAKLHFTINIRDRTVVSQLDLLFVGIGSHRAGLFQREVLLSRAAKSTTREYFGDITCLPFNREGDEITALSRGRSALFCLSELHELAVSPTALVIGAAGGKDKIDAIQTVLQRKYISVLITDSETASALLEA